MSTILYNMLQYCSVLYNMKYLIEMHWFSDGGSNNLKCRHSGGGNVGSSRSGGSNTRCSARRLVPEAALAAVAATQAAAAATETAVVAAAAETATHAGLCT